MNKTASEIADQVLVKVAAVLTAKKRDALSKKQFVFPKKGEYPINDKAHARNALARVSQFGSSSQKAKVRAKVRAKYPSIKQGK